MVNKDINRIVYTNNFFVHDCEPAGNLPPNIFNKITFSSIKCVTKKVEKLQDIGFKASQFLNKSNLRAKKISFKGTEYSFYLYPRQPRQAAINYLNKYLSNSILLCFEFQKEALKYLEKAGITYINFWNHPFKLLDDLAIYIETNSKKIQSKLRHYEIPKEKFNLYAKYWQQRLFFTKHFSKVNKKLMDNSLLIIGQTEIDKSIEQNGYILSLNDFQDKINHYKKVYNKIYYSPHPLLFNKWGIAQWKNFPNLVKFLKKNPKIEVVKHSTYHILASDKINKVVAISSSVLYEAQYFDKEIEYLFKPLFDSQSNKNGVGVENQQLFNPEFWGNILSPFFKVSNLTSIKFDNLQNKCRELAYGDNLYWGYKNLNKK